MSKKPEKIIDLFQKNELNVSRLYELYAQKIPNQKNFWLKLSDEEIDHAKDIGHAYGENISQDLFEENKFSRGVIKYVSDFIEEKIREARKGEITHLEALNNALRIEQSILEKKCFEIFIPKNITLKEVLKNLNKETDKHVERIRKELQKQG